MKAVLNSCAVLLLLSSGTAYAQVKIDASSDAVRKAAGKIYLDDLSVNDTAMLYYPFCIKEESLYIMGWSVPVNLATNTYEQTGVILRVEVMPGKKLKATYVDAAQAQKVARGNATAPSSLSKADYNKAVIEQIDRIFSGGFFWDTGSCDELQQRNPLRPLNLFAVQSINGFAKISDLLASVTAPTSNP